MTTETSKSEKCKKCGGIMIKRVITVKNTAKIKLINIFQCKVCRYWETIDD